MPRVVPLVLALVLVVLPSQFQTPVRAAAIPPTLRPVRLRELENQQVQHILFQHLHDKPFGNPKLRAAMRTAEGDGFQRRFFRQDLKVIENLYRGTGYMSVAIAAQRFYLDEAEGLHIYLDIDSGRRWTVAEVELTLADSAGEANFDATPLREVLRVRTGGAFLYGDVLDDERGLLAHLNGRGYAHAQVQNRMELNADQSTARVVYEVAPGRRMYFGPIRITGRPSGDDGGLRTRRSLIERKLSFSEGELYDPEELWLTRNELARTGLFRSAILSLPPVAPGDSLQPIEVVLQEKKQIHLEASAFLNNAEPGLAANIQHRNWLGRGTRLGLDANLGRPLQGSTGYLTERDVFETGADLTVSAGLIDEWGRRQVFANPEDSLQFALITTNHSLSDELNLLFGQETAAAYISAIVLSYPSVERLWEFNSSLSRRWEPTRGAVYESHLGISWAESRNRPLEGKSIDLDDGGARADTTAWGVPTDGDGSFPDDEFFPDDGGLDDAGFADGDGEGAAGNGDVADPFPYDEDPIHIDRVWQELLTDEARTLNFALSFQRDTRDNQINPSQGALLRLAGLYAIEFGGRSTRVVDGDVEARYYLPLGRHAVWAQSGRLAMTGSLRKDRGLPQAYWQELGGEGSVRGVARNAIQAVGGGRIALNLRQELRLRKGAAGLVLFWDRGGVWRHGGDATWWGMKDGYGAGLRYDIGIPFRLDAGWTTGFEAAEVYFSIGQAF